MQSTTSKVKKVLYYLRIPTAVGLLVLLLYKIGLNNLLDSLSKINLLYQAPLLIIWLAGQVLGTMALIVLIKPLKLRVTFRQMFRRFMVSWSFAFVTPARAGEFLMANYLLRDGLPLTRGIALVLIDKIVTLTVSLVIAIAGAYVLFGIETGFVLTTLLAVCMLVFMVVSGSDRMECIIEGFLSRRFEPMSGGYSQLREYFSSLRWVLAVNLFITVFKFVMHGGFLWVVFLSIGVHPPVYITMLVTALVQVIVLVPITVSGLGLREGATVALFSMAGVDASASFTAAIITTFLAYIYASVSFLIFSHAAPKAPNARSLNAEEGIALSENR